MLSKSLALDLHRFFSYQQLHSLSMTYQTLYQGKCLLHFTEMLIIQEVDFSQIFTARKEQI